MAVLMIEYNLTVRLAPPSLPEAWKTFLATAKGLTHLGGRVLISDVYGHLE